MPTSPALRIPSYRRHKATGQAVVTLSGREIYLGKHGTKASRDEYDRVVTEWLAAGRCLPLGDDLTVTELAVRYWKFAEAYYQKNGRPTGSIHVIRGALKLLRRSYGPTLAADFGPLALEALQHKLIARKLSRNTINEMIACIRRAFRWAVAKQMLSPVVLQALEALPGLRKGRTAAREPQPVRPVSDDVVEATLPALSAVVATMVRFQRLTGCRPAEVCAVRPCDVETSNDVWCYRPESHKTDHHGGCERVIHIGPQAQQVLRPFLLRSDDSYCFAPAESERKRSAMRRELRRSPMTPSQARRRLTRHRRRPPGNCYTTDSYRRAIDRAVEAINRRRETDAKKAGLDEFERLPDWSPNQLRHSMATEIRRRFGLEAAQVVLGHVAADVTQIYAEKNGALADEVMRKIG